MSQFAELRPAPSLVLIPLSYGFDNRRPSQRALASDARGLRSGRRPCVCLVLSSSAGARCAVVSSNATLFPPLEHSAGRTWHRREHAPVCHLSALLRHEPSLRCSLMMWQQNGSSRRWLTSARGQIVSAAAVMSEQTKEKRAVQPNEGRSSVRHPGLRLARPARSKAARSQCSTLWSTRASEHVGCLVRGSAHRNRSRPPRRRGSGARRRRSRGSRSRCRS